MTPIRKIAITTGGGDAPGLNAVIRAVTISAIRLGWEVVGIRQSYRGLLEMRPEEGLIPLTEERVRGITHIGGTILGTDNRGDPFDFPTEVNGTFMTVDRSDELVEKFRANGFDALVAIGGDGSLGIAHKLHLKGVPVVGVPKTIDNDLQGTVITFGFDTAVTSATDAIDKLHPTTESHRRVMVVEVMGRYAGWIALNAGVSGAAGERRGREYSIVVVAEGARPKDGIMKTRGEKEAGREVRLGGIAEWLADEINRRTAKETRSMVLGHLQRGGTPTTFDRLLALRFGAAAVRTLSEGRTGVMVGLDPPTVTEVPLEDAIRRMKNVPSHCDTILTARSLGTCLGD
jgi:6-phosphofructokinase 1